jgi:hypothetical protein
MVVRARYRKDGIELVSLLRRRDVDGLVCEELYNILK